MHTGDRRGLAPGAALAGVVDRRPRSHAAYLVAFGAGLVAAVGLARLAARADPSGARAPGTYLGSRRRDAPGRTGRGLETAHADASRPRRPRPTRSSRRCAARSAPAGTVKMVGTGHSFTAISAPERHDAPARRA